MYLDLYVHTNDSIINFIVCLCLQVVTMTNLMQYDVHVLPYDTLKTFLTSFILQGCTSLLL